MFIPLELIIIGFDPPPSVINGVIHSINGILLVLITGITRAITASRPKSQWGTSRPWTTSCSSPFRVCSAPPTCWIPPMRWCQNYHLSGRRTVRCWTKQRWKNRAFNGKSPRKYGRFMGNYGKIRGKYGKIVEKTWEIHETSSLNDGL